MPVARGLFRAYDVRGIYAEDLTEASTTLIGQAIGTRLAATQDAPVILLGRDARLSSPALATAVSTGLMRAGCQVIDLGILPTPVLYFAIQSGLIPNGIMITGSHNPPNHNGIKMVLDGHCLHTDAIQELYASICNKQLRQQPASGQHKPLADMLQHYVNSISQQVRLQRRLRVGLDCGNGAAALVAVELFTAIGCEVHPLYCEVDGTFPNHSPDPTRPENLRDLQELVRSRGLDIGLAFDGDGDRVIAVDGNGHILWPDRILMLLAQHVLAEHPGRMVVYDVKCTHQLDAFIRSAGGEPAICISGHSLLKEFIWAHDAVLGGEFSGHIVLRDRGMDYDDGIYVGARLLEALSLHPASPAEVFATLPEGVSTHELKVRFASIDAAKAAMAIWQADQNLQAERLITLDGLRAEYAYGWGLARASNTYPGLTLRFEADTAEQLKVIQDHFRSDIMRLKLADTLPF